MKKQSILVFILAIYSLFLANLLLFKINLLKFGRLRFRFTDNGTAGRANFLPFKTILPYLLGKRGWLIAMINLGGNIILFVPIGFLVPFVYQKMNWQKALALAVAAPLLIEGIQLVFRLGIFDIDDVILNALGIIVGYSLYRIILKRRSS